MPAVSAQLSHFLAPTERADKRPGAFARFFTLLQEARMRQAEREVARFIEGRGGRITDALERQIERHFV
ncbi:hypothetical protein [uncultured Enterovirga sp.]|uniref:hypothetical protein n=1 Tax=uncultured Enterovirga sp. TaxID=2026352 RepID=UPI0035CACF38